MQFDDESHETISQLTSNSLTSIISIISCDSYIATHSQLLNLNVMHVCAFT